MVPKKTLKLVKSLQLKKYRQQEKLFLVEGVKSITELLISSFRIRTLVGTSVFIDQHKSLISKRLPESAIYQAKESDISSVSSFKNNNAGVAVVEMPALRALPITLLGYALVLDNIRDPGNLGTIIRIADWYGISTVICSPETTDEFHPKVISASMGSFLRVSVYRANLTTYLQKVKLPVYGTLVSQGTSVHELNFAPQGLILLGNESEGISEPVKEYITDAVHIPQFGTAESLNVSIAAAVICDNMKRNTTKNVG
ncbi:TrmH family RNA methyltransferase [Tunicatimonas pelagia]|uniref:TrmH family RNA methyltransferase n=1 Tax=Tunicatimonas pelagia TaxID=931531 RepID=UPI0026661CC8|nr:RNA methyltransferase [Tunicatimonas pelagia]WKN41586.1 RNA methyltransferase [Tunicatimonas pelagia]